jgi:hypothetical protein
MKNNLVILSLVAVFTLFAGFGFAGTATMRISVPFDFYAGDQQLPAGEYTFQMGSPLAQTASVVTVRAKGGEGLCILATQPGTDLADAKLLFNKYGNKHFLTSVSIKGLKAGVQMMQLEKELRAQAERGRNTVIIAQR